MKKWFIIALFVLTPIVATGVGVGVGMAELQNSYEMRTSYSEVETVSLDSMRKQARYRGSWARKNGLPIERNPYNEQVFLDGQEIGGVLHDAYNEGWNNPDN